MKQGRGTPTYIIAMVSILLAMASNILQPMASKKQICFICSGNDGLIIVLLGKIFLQNVPLAHIVEDGNGKAARTLHAMHIHDNDLKHPNLQRSGAVL